MLFVFAHVRVHPLVFSKCALTLCRALVAAVESMSLAARKANGGVIKSARRENNQLPPPPPALHLHVLQRCESSTRLLFLLSAAVLTDGRWGF